MSASKQELFRQIEKTCPECGAVKMPTLSDQQQFDTIAKLNRRLQKNNAELLAACKAVEETGVIVTIGLMTQIRAAIAAAEGE